MKSETEICWLFCGEILNDSRGKCLVVKYFVVKCLVIKRLVVKCLVVKFLDVKCLAVIRQAFLLSSVV